MSEEISSSQVVAGNEAAQVSMDSPEVKEKIKALAVVLQASDNNDYEAGQLCDQIVELIGIQHGKSTILNIANLPEIQRSPRELRRRWKYYRLVSHKDCKSPDLDELIEKKHGVVKELARIIDTDMTEEDKIGLVKALASETILKKRTVAYIRDRVTKELVWRDMQLRKPPEKKKTNHKHSPKPNGTVVDSEMLKQYAECIRSYGKFCKIESIKDQLAVKTVSAAFVYVVGKQAEQLKGDEEYAYFLSKLINQLQQIQQSILGNNGTEEITPIEVKEAEQQMATESTNQGEIFVYNEEEIPKIESYEAEQ